MVVAQKKQSSILIVTQTVNAKKTRDVQFILVAGGGRGNILVVHIWFTCGTQAFRQTQLYKYKFFAQTT